MILSSECRGTLLSLFAYRRPDHASRVFEALMRAERVDELDIHVFIDGPKGADDAADVEAVRSFFRPHAEAGTITLTLCEENKGLSRSIVSGVGRLMAGAEQVIVLEDDVLPSPYFIDYMLKGLDYYRNDPRIMSIHGYNPPMTPPNDYDYDVYFNPRHGAWGWGMWRDRWESLDLSEPPDIALLNDPDFVARCDAVGTDMKHLLRAENAGEIDSWATRLCVEQFKQRRFTVYPVCSQVRNLGMDGTGVHSGTTTRYDVDLSNATPIRRFAPKPIVDDGFMGQYRHYHDFPKERPAGLFKRLERRVRHWRKRRSRSPGAQ